MTELSSLRSLSDELAALTERARLGLALPYPTRLPATGLVWSPGRVLTVAHAMGARDEGRVVLPGGEVAAARIVGRDPTLDLALLEVDGAEPGPLSWAASSALRPGELALVVGLRGQLVDGAPQLSTTADLGTVRAVGGPWRTRGGARVERWLEVGVALTPGASGGVLVSTAGELVGLNTHGLRRGGATLPVETLRAAVAQLAKGGSVRPGFLGVGVQPARVEIAGEPTGTAGPAGPAGSAGSAGPAGSAGSAGGHRVGVLLNAVREGSPAAAAGLMVGDVLLSIDGEAITSYRDLRAVLLGRGGERVKIALVRGGAPRELEAHIGQREPRAAD